MNLTGETASASVTEDGTAILTMAHVRSNGANIFQVTIAESDDLGIWIRVQRDDRPHLLLLRWDYILSLEVRERLNFYKFRGITETS